MGRWRCEVCAIGLEEADRRRRELGKRGITLREKTCSLECANERRARMQQAAIRTARRRAPDPYPRGRAGDWRCSECGADLAAARTKRRRAGLREVLITGQVTCTPACKAARTRRLLAWGTARRAGKVAAGRRSAKRRHR